MPNVRGENKIAVLLTSLPQSVSERVLARLGPERGSRLRGLMEQARTETSPQVVDAVLREFDSLLTQAMNPAMPRIALDTVPETDVYEPSRALTAPGRPQPPRPAAPTGDPLAELQLLDGESLAAALKGEHPRGVATVLSCLDAKKACDTLKRLPPEVRKVVFPRLGQTAGGGNDIALRIVQAVVAKSRAVAEERGQSGGDDKAQKMADMLKSMERADRSDLMSALAEQDEALAAAVREKLYVFDDLAVIGGQSMQKLLAEIDSKTLAVALKDAADAIAERVMGNLSKRARETLTEEISFLGSISESQVQQARKSVVDVYQRMDQAGELG